MPPTPRPKYQSCRIVKWRWSGRSDDQRAFKVEWFLQPDVLDPGSDVFVQRIDAKAVLLGIDDREKPFAEDDPFGRADQALEDRILDALPEVFTGLGCVPEASTAFGGYRGDVIGDQVKHEVPIDCRGLIRLAEDARGIALGVASEVTGEEFGLEERELSDANLGTE